MTYLIICAVDSNEFKLFKFDFGGNQDSFLVSKDMKSVFRLIQMSGLESSANSYFLDDQVISGNPCGENDFKPNNLHFRWKND